MNIMETSENRNKNRHCCGGKRPRAGWIILGVIGFTAFAFLFGAVVMWLWNWLMPVLFHLTVITYWQAIGLAILARLLFGSLHHKGAHGPGHKFGPWKRKYHGNHDWNCGGNSNSGRWGYYEQYWNEEGEKSFNDYVRRKTEMVKE
jgi:hypothetical protein